VNAEAVSSVNPFKNGTCVALSISYAPELALKIVGP